MDKPKILFIGDYCRTDYLSMLDMCRDACEFWFLYFSSPDEEHNKAYLNYGQAIYWSDYRSAQDLLKALAPHKVLFLYIDTYHAVVLNIACKAAGIFTYHLEHGMRADYGIACDATISPQLYQSPYNKFRTFLYNFGNRIKSRLFLKNSIRQFSEEDAAFAKEYISVRGRKNYIETFKLLASPKRLPDCYISFSPKVYAVHQQHDHLTGSQKVHFIGIPYFDELATVRPTIPERAILFIDQPLAEKQLLKWSPAYKKTFVEELATIARQLNYKLYVKPHPDQDITPWQGIAEGIDIIDDAQLLERSGSISIVIGFYSTYLMPFAAFEHTTLITLENHPAGKLDVSKSFVDAGVAHPVYSLDELPEALDNIEQLHQQQLPNKKKFEQDWLYKFDGKAGERLRDILLRNEL
ncbi:polysialyltransferase family glycosyltransferase [Pontibacter pudoricolor]|uniref:polysialyltransferase family glycosyltransferase n=1 Tax=Pontibacter pudoricolor TaxID=2694930 RepID=UPI0013914F9D|nr:polysialyltransferase family glycosyltransferase [Pontibacter pudoricolor]